MIQSRSDARRFSPDRPVTGGPTKVGSEAAPVQAVQLLRFTQHSLFAAVVLVAFVKGITGPSPLLTSVLSAGLTVWYLIGLLLERAHRSVVVAAVWLVVLTILCIGAIFVASDFAWVSFALFVLYASVLPARTAYVVIFGLAISVGLMLVFRWPSDRHWAAQFIGPLMGAAAAAGLVAVYRTAARESSERQRLIDELLRTQDDLARAQLDAGVRRERERVSAEVHDTIAQSFASTVFLARKAMRALDAVADTAVDADDIDASRDVRATLEEIVRTGSVGLDDARRLVRGLPPHELSDQGLLGALGALVGTPAADAEPQMMLRVDGEATALSDDIEAALLRVAQEALSNAREHSGANRIVITVTYDNDSVSLDVVDDGQGFDQSATPGRKGRDRGYGTRVMAKRIADIGGIFMIESDPGSGTAVSASVKTGRAVPGRNVAGRWEAGRGAAES